MKSRGEHISVILLLALTNMSIAQEVKSPYWTDTTYPEYITKITDFGERADWSHDGKRILFVERSFGDVYEYNLETGKYKPQTHHYYHGGYVRALYLSNGDILLSGVKDFPGENWKEARFRLAELWILDKDLGSPPVRLGEYCWEGPAVSRTQLKIAWAQHHGLYPESKRYYKLWIGEIDYSSGKPQIVNQKVILDNYRDEVKNMLLEPQNFIPGKESELTVQAWPNCEVFGLDYLTGHLINYSNDSNSYDEPEGIYPDGKYTLVESSRHNSSNSGANIDIWKLQLTTDQANWVRITWFNEGGSFKASNPVVSDDGRYIAFQVAGKDEVAGIGHGIYIMDLEKRVKALEK